MISAMVKSDIMISAIVVIMRSVIILNGVAPSTDCKMFTLKTSQALGVHQIALNSWQQTDSFYLSILQQIHSITDIMVLK
jgi:hypothetical protein